MRRSAAAMALSTTSSGISPRICWDAFSAALPSTWDSAALQVLVVSTSLRGWWRSAAFTSSSSPEARNRVSKASVSSGESLPAAARQIAGRTSQRSNVEDSLCSPCGPTSSERTCSSRSPSGRRDGGV